MEAEGIIERYLEMVGGRLEFLGEAVESKQLLHKLTINEWLTELRLEYIRMEIEDFLVAKLGEGRHTVGNAYVIILWDNEEGCHSVDTDGDYLELYCEMVKDDMTNNRQTLLGWMEERDRLTLELMGMKNKDQYIIDAYSKRIGELSKQIREATDPPDYKRWWQAVYEEVALLRQQREQVKQSLAQAEPLRKAKALRQIINHIVVEWATEPSTDRRHKGGVRTFCKSVRVIGTNGNETEIMTNETPSA